jgi:hypothetical protein
MNTVLKSIILAKIVVNTMLRALGDLKSAVMDCPSSCCSEIVTSVIGESFCNNDSIYEVILLTFPEFVGPFSAMS